MNLDFKKFFENNNVKLSSKEKIIFLEQLGNLLNSGIPIINSFKILELQTKNKKTKTIIKKALSDLSTGKALSIIFKKFPKTFNSFDIAILEMGELTGELGNSIDLIMQKEEKQKELRGKIIGALVYPIVIITLSVAMIFVFMLYVIPKVKDMYADAKANLPALTKTVIQISEFIENNIVTIIAIIFIFILIIKFFKSSKYTKIYWDNFILRIPIFGNLIKKGLLALFTNSLGTLIEKGVIINKALEISTKSLQNSYYEKELNKINQRLKKGEALSSLMGINEISEGKQNFYFPIELSSIVKIGEQTGKTPELLQKISKKFNKEIDNITKNLSKAIEPIVIIFVGIIVGTLIMAIMLPFFNMVNVI